MKKFLLSFALFIAITGYSSSSAELTLYEFFYKHTLLKGPELAEFLNEIYIQSETRNIYLSKAQIDYANRVTLEQRINRLLKRQK